MAHDDADRRRVELRHARDQRPVQLRAYFSIGTLIIVPLVVLFARLRQKWMHSGLVLTFILFFQVAAGLAAFEADRALGQMMRGLWGADRGTPTTK